MFDRHGLLGEHKFRQYHIFDPVTTCSPSNSCYNILNYGASTGSQDNSSAIAAANARFKPAIVQIPAGILIFHDF